MILQQRSRGWWCVANVGPGEVSCEHGERIEKDAHSNNAVRVADPERPLMASIISLVDPTSRLENRMEASFTDGIIFGRQMTTEAGSN